MRDNGDLSLHICDPSVVRIIKLRCSELQMRFVQIGMEIHPVCNRLSRELYVRV